MWLFEVWCSLPNLSPVAQRKLANDSMFASMLVKVAEIVAVAVVVVVDAVSGWCLQ